MKRRVQTAAALAAIAVCATGCASSPPHVPHGSVMTMPNGRVMSMAPGRTMTGAMRHRQPEAASPAAAVTPGPSEAAAMVCSHEVRSDLTAALAVRRLPAGTSIYTYTHGTGVFRCTYRLPAGPLALTVTELPDGRSAARYFTTERARLRTTRPLAGLTAQAAGTPAGVVTLVKDNFVLTVDARRLPAVFGRQRERRADFAYEVASLILGCWTGN